MSSSYKSSDKSLWKGRVDGETEEYLRWHQVIEVVDLNQTVDSLKSKAVFLGFCSDEGVRRNKGRVGAKEAPGKLREVLSGLPYHSKGGIVDAGDVVCEGSDLEGAQEELGIRVAQILSDGGRPVVLGGGHEVTYGHYLGIRKAFPEKKIGIINLDAHLDIRELSNGKGNSGTGFFQIIEKEKNNKGAFHYLAVGIQPIGNTKALYKYSKENNVEIIEADNVQSSEELIAIQGTIQNFANKVDVIYLTIDMDVFAAPYAPGVSALNYNGLVPSGNIQKIYKQIIQLPNLKSIDVAELNPKFDSDNRTARLAADLVFKLI